MLGEDRRLRRGRRGDDITRQVQESGALPLQLAGVLGEVEVRGELYWPRAAFKAYNQELLAKGEKIDSTLAPTKVDTPTTKGVPSKILPVVSLTKANIQGRPSQGSRMTEIRPEYWSTYGVKRKANEDT